jgi:hypothetical protein
MGRQLRYPVMYLDSRFERFSATAKESHQLAALEIHQTTAMCFYGAPNPLGTALNRIHAFGVAETTWQARPASDIHAKNGQWVFICCIQVTHFRRIKPMTSDTRNSNMNMKNRILAISTAPAAMPVKPNSAAISAIMKNIMAYRNMMTLLFGVRKITSRSLQQGYQSSSS